MPLDGRWGERERGIKKNDATITGGAIKEYTKMLSN